MKRLTLLLIFLGILYSGAPGAAAEPFSHTLADGPVSFSWTVGDGVLKGKLNGRTTGWVAVGFNPEKMMMGANFIMGYVKNGRVTVTDHVGHTERNHKPDTKAGGVSNTSDTSGSESAGITEILFTIPLDSGDPADTPIDPEGMTTVLLALGGGRDSFKSVHSFRAVHRVNLSTGASEKVK